MYKSLVAIIKFFTQIWRGVKVIGQENLPTEGGAVVAGNHTTWFDPFAIAIASKRPVHFMAKEELFHNPVLKWLLPRVYVFPVKRGLADREAIRTAQNRVAEGHFLGIFPEGTRNKDTTELMQLQGGAALIALKMGVPVVPVVVSDVSPSRFRRPIEVRIGKPIDLGGPKRANKAEVSEATELISAEFSSLFKKE